MAAWKLCRKFSGVYALELDSESGTQPIRIDNSSDWLKYTFEKHLFYADMIMKVFQVACGIEGTTSMCMN